MRSKEVKKAIKVMQRDLKYYKEALENEIAFDDGIDEQQLAYLHQQTTSYETLLAYIEELEQNSVSKDKIREYLEKRINDVKKAYDDLTEPYYIEGVGFNISYMTKKELSMRNVLVNVFYYANMTSSFTFAAIREKSAHFCRYSCASSVIL